MDNQELQHRREEWEKFMTEYQLWNDVIMTLHKGPGSRDLLRNFIKYLLEKGTPEALTLKKEVLEKSPCFIEPTLLRAEAEDFKEILLDCEIFQGLKETTMFGPTYEVTPEELSDPSWYFPWGTSLGDLSEDNAFKGAIGMVGQRGRFYGTQDYGLCISLAFDYGDYYYVFRSDQKPEKKSFESMVSEFEPYLPTPKEPSEEEIEAKREVGEIIYIYTKDKKYYATNK